MHQNNQSTSTFEYLIGQNALTSEEWKQYIKVLKKHGISTVSALLETEEEVLNQLQDIPQIPLAKIKQFHKKLTQMQIKTSNTFSNALGTNDLFLKHQFIPQFSIEIYLKNCPISDQKFEISKAIKKANECATNSDDSSYLTKQEASLIALYCQEPLLNSSDAFYSIINRDLRERNPRMFKYLSALYLLDSGIRRLKSKPPNTITWRGMNVAPDLNKFQVGRNVCFTGICSTTSRKQVTLNFMEMEPRDAEHKRTLFKLLMINGKSISRFSRWENEDEIIAEFCSCWQVIKVSIDHYENFNASMPAYHCDYYIELQQIEGESLFSESSSSSNNLSGIQILLEVDYQSIYDSKNVKNDFEEFFYHLHDDKAKTILITYLIQKGHWDGFAQQLYGGTSEEELNDDTSEEQLNDDTSEEQLNDNTSEEQLRNDIIYLFAGLQSLKAGLIQQNIELKNALYLCEQKEIYSWIDLKKSNQGNTRSLQDFQNIGFSLLDSQKLNEENKQDNLLLEYHSKNSDSSERQLKHFIIRDGLVISFYRITQLIVDGVQAATKTTLSSPLLRIAGRWGFVLQRSDVYTAKAMLAMQTGFNALQFWYGYITTKQFIKKFVVAVFTIGAGLLEAVVGTILCPIGGIAVLIAAMITGATFSTAVASVTKLILEKILPDGEEEHINAQRKLYYQTLATLKCQPSSTRLEVRKQYYQLLLENHPDKHPNNIEKATENTQVIIKAYEIIEAYHEALNKACEDLGLCYETLTTDSLSKWKGDNQCLIPTVFDKFFGKQLTRHQRSYIIIHRHLAFAEQVSFKYLRTLLDQDREKDHRIKTLCVSKPLPAVPANESNKS